jgi:electron transfer flavoprotein beta subunit
LEQKAGPAELSLCGQQSADGQSAQVGPQLAQCLNLPFVGRGLEASLHGGVLRVRQETEDGVALAEADLPCVAAFDKSRGEPRFPTVKSSMDASRAAIPTLELTEIPAPLVTVRETRPASRGVQGVKICERTGEDSAKQLFRLLNAAGVL